MVEVEEVVAIEVRQRNKTHLQNLDLSINANPASIDENQTTVISWNANNANNCSATGGWSASTATSGSQTVGPLSTNTTYSMTCNGAGARQQNLSL